jgi:hypothetical protein
MNNATNTASAAGHGPTAFARHSARELACPHCNGSVYRVPRRLVDRFISMIVLRHRYRCSALYCHWEGNLPPTRLSMPSRLPR